jgi:hypothetical protein
VDDEDEFMCVHTNTKHIGTNSEFNDRCHPTEISNSTGLSTKMSKSDSTFPLGHKLGYPNKVAHCAIDSDDLRRASAYDELPKGNQAIRIEMEFKLDMADRSQVLFSVGGCTGFHVRLDDVAELGTSGMGTDGDDTNRNGDSFSD